MKLKSVICKYRKSNGGFKMKNYLFELTNDGNKKVEEISTKHFYYEVYNEFLEKFHMTNIIDNEDFVPYIIKNNKALMVFRTNLNIEDLRFDVLELLGNFI